jgi:hypothetical protein
MKRITTEPLIEGFSKHASLQQTFMLEGNWRKANEQIKKINSIFEKIKAIGAREELLKLIESEKPEVAILAATYSMKYNPERCLAKMEELHRLQIPHISSHAMYAIQNWKSNEWYID